MAYRCNLKKIIDNCYLDLKYLLPFKWKKVVWFSKLSTLFLVISLVLDYWASYRSLNIKIYCIEMLFSGFFQSDFVMLSLVYTELFSDFVAVLWSDTCKIFFSPVQIQSTTKNSSSSKAKAIKNGKPKAIKNRKLNTVTE